KPRSMAWSAKGRYLATSGSEAAILWPFHFKDGPQGRQPLQLGVRPVMAVRVACHPSEEVVAVGYADGAVAVVRIADQKAVQLRAPAGSPISALAFDDKGRTLSVGAEDGKAALIVL